MPISRDEFESGQILTQLEKSIISFLDKNRGNAFTTSEIMDGIKIQTSFSDFFKALLSGITIVTFPSILNNLVAKRKIRYNLIQGQYYYMANK